MKINYKSIQEVEVLSYDGDINIYNELNHSSFINSFKSVKGKITLSKVDDYLIIDFDLDYLIDAISMISFKNFDYKSNLKEKLYLTNNKDFETEDIIFYDDGFLLEELIYSLIITDLPINLSIEGEKYEEGEGYKVLSEDDLNNLDNDESPFDCLKDIDFK